MRTNIWYGTRPGEKVTDRGFFICPFCKHTRPYVRKAVVKEIFFGVIKVKGSNPLFEYVRCGSCLRSMDVNILAYENQKELQISNEPLPPTDIYNKWEELYEILIGDKDKRTVENWSPILETCEKLMKDAGLKIKMGMYEEAKPYLYNILKGAEMYFQGIDESKMKYKLDMFEPQKGLKHEQYSEAVHTILSQLP